MELRFWIIGIIMFSGVFALMTVAFHDAASGYDRTDLINPELEDRYDQLNEQVELVGGLKDTVSGDEGLKVLNVLGTIFTGTIGVLNAVLASVTFIPTVFANFASDFGIPTIVTNIFFTMVALIITVLLIFAIINAIRR